LAEYEGVIYAPRSQSLSGMPPSGGGEDNAMFAKLAAVAQRHEYLLHVVAECTEAVARAGAVLDRVGALLDDREQEFLHYRYILGMSWDEVQEKMYHSRMSLSRIRSSILQKIAKIEKNGTKCD
jgi:hypothetical protein